MKPLNLRILTGLLMILLLATLSACSSTDRSDIPSGDSVETTEQLKPIEGYEGYVVMRGDTAVGEELEAALLLRNAFTDINITTDWVKRGTPIPETGKELLVGNTNRPESAEVAASLLWDDYAIVTKGDRVVIVGGSPSATYKAVEHFIRDQSDYTYKHEYKSEVPTLNNVSLKDYIIRVPHNDYGVTNNYALALKDYFIENFGINLAVETGDEKEGEYELIIGVDDRLKVDGYFYGFADDGKTFMINGQNRFGLTYSMSIFKELLASTDKLVLDSNSKKEGVATYFKAELHIDSEKGSDSNDGSSSKPLKTLDKTLEVASALSSAAPYDITICFADGNYPISEPLIFTSDGLCANYSKLTFKNEKNASPVITALVPVDKFSETTVNGVKAWVADMPAEIPYTHQAFAADGTRLTRPRYPETDALSVKGHPTEKNPFVEQRLPVTEMTFHEGDIPQLTNIEDIQLRIFHYWVDEMLELKSIDYENNIISFTDKSIYSLRKCGEAKGADYYLDNVFEALDKPGEFYVNRAEKKLYYIPKSGEKLGATTIYVSAPLELMELDGVDNVRFEGLTFEGTDWTQTKRLSSQAAADIPHAINVTNSDNISFNNCKFTRIGHSVINIDSGSSNIDITHCDFKDIGAAAIYIRGTNANPVDPETVIHDVNISDCNIESYGRVYANAVGINLMYAYDCNISHNEIHDGYYSGISCGWVWGFAHHVTNNISIDNNHIYNIGQGKLSDMGGIYMLGMQPGTVIRQNLVHDVKMLNYGGWGIYLDEGSSDILVENNVSYDCSAYPFFQHYGMNSLIKNNIFAFGILGQYGMGGKFDDNTLTLEGNILISNGTPIYAKPFEQMNIVCRNNLVWDYTKTIVGGIDDLVRDPLFKDVKNYDFTLAEDSPAFSIGFKPIDMSKVGIREAE